MYYGNFFTIIVVTKKIQKSKITKTLHGGLAWRLSFALCITHMQDCFNYSTIFNHFNSADIIVHNKIIKNPAELMEKKKKKKKKKKKLLIHVPDVFPLKIRLKHDETCRGDF